MSGIVPPTPPAMDIMTGDAAHHTSVVAASPDVRSRCADEEDEVLVADTTGGSGECGGARSVLGLALTFYCRSNMVFCFCRSGTPRHVWDNSSDPSS